MPHARSIDAADPVNSQAILGDKVTLAAIAPGAAAAVTMDFQSHEPWLGIVGALLLTGIGAVAFLLAPGELEFHAGVFVTPT